MITYIIRRLLLTIVVFLGVTIIAFTLIKLTPGDPLLNTYGLQPTGDTAFVEQLRDKLGLDEPVHVQYGKFILRLFEGDLGRSISSGRPVISLISEALPNTVILILTSISIAIIIGIPFGVISAVKHNRKIDHTLRIGSIFLASIPDFWLAIMLIMVFSYYLGLTPISGYGSVQHLLLPSITLGLGLSAIIIRLTRSTLLEILNQDYIRAAFARGLSAQRVLIKHALRNSLIPIITIVGLQLGFLITGAFFVEWVFGWPGIGRLTVQAISQRDYPLIMGALLVTSVAYVVINLVVDVIYAYVDPRIQYK